MNYILAQLIERYIHELNNCPTDQQFIERASRSSSRKRRDVAETGRGGEGRRQPSLVLAPDLRAAEPAEGRRQEGEEDPASVGRRRQKETQGEAE